MGKFEDIFAVRFIRNMRGGAQSILVEASDGNFYVVKSPDNLQGPNVLFNEVVGTELFRQAGLPVPEWKPIYLSPEFLRENSACRYETGKGWQRRRPGWCFGSRMMGLSSSRLFEILPEKRIPQILNRKDFLKAWALDVFCEHSDYRQAIFLEMPGKKLNAVFIDHGHLLGGPDGQATPVIWAPLYLDLNIYADALPDCADEIEDSIRRIDLRTLTEVVNGLAANWITPLARRNFAALRNRLSDPMWVTSTSRTLLRLIKLIRRENDNGKVSIPGIRLDGSALCAEISRHTLRARFGGWNRDFAGGQAREKDCSLCRPGLAGSNI